MELSALRHDWNEAAQADALWAVSTEPERDNGRWEPDEFFDRGMEELAPLLDLVDAGERALDFGCGVGRTTRALAEKFESVTGLDISPEMISRAKALNPSLTFLPLSPEPRINFPDKHFDLAFSYKVLQHNPPALACAFIRELVRVAHTVLIQAPRRSRAGEPVIPHTEEGRELQGYPAAVRMHELHESRVRGALRSAGATITREIATPEPGGWTSIVYLAQKP